MNRGDRAALFARARYRCESCGCHEGRAVLVGTNVWADELIEETPIERANGDTTFSRHPFRRWYNVFGQPSPPPKRSWRSRIVLELAYGHVMCNRCARRSREARYPMPLLAYPRLGDAA